MSYSQPAILRKSAKKRQEILDAVDEVVSIAASKMRAYQDISHNEVSNLSGVCQSRSIQLSSIDKGIRFICGRTQQRYLKRFLRQWKVSMEAQKIAQETGVAAEQIEEIFKVMLSEYVPR